VATQAYYCNLKDGKKYKLWTFQSVASVKELKITGILEASWDRYMETGAFYKSYRWMVKQLADRAIHFNGHPPIWAWHSCRKYRNPPTLLDARCLLSDIEIENGIQTIEFECPVEFAVLSSYGEWNRLFYEYFHSTEEIEIDKESVDWLFQVERNKFRIEDSIQATLPFLMLDWVIGIRDLNLKPNDFTYNEEEKV
jgi:hypothetical protein